jgi:hypothetical protein
MASCNCKQTELTVVLRLPIACVHRRVKREKAKSRGIHTAHGSTEVCGECRSRMRAQDDGWQIDLENNPSCTCKAANS